MLPFAFGLSLRCVLQCRVLKDSLVLEGEGHKGGSDLHSKTPAFEKRIAIVSCDLGASLWARDCAFI